MYTSAQIINMDIDEIEKVAHQANGEYDKGSENFLIDTDFRRCIERLEKEKPNSPVLLEVSSLDSDIGSELTDLDFLLVQNPMKSVESVSDIDDLSKFYAYKHRFHTSVLQVASLKADGYSIRILYINGHLVASYTRGRNTKGKDITHIAKLLLPEYIDEFTKFSAVELRCELVLPFEGHKKLRQMHPVEVSKNNLINARNSVSFLLKDGIPDEEIKLLKPMVFNIIVPDDELDNADWTRSRSAKLGKSKELGLNTLTYTTFTFDMHEGMTPEEIVFAIVSKFGEDVKEQCGFLSDGVVICIDDEEMSKNLGYSGSKINGMLGLKIIQWKAEEYTAIIKRIYYSSNKSKKYKSIMAEIEPTEMSNGNTVTSVDLKSPFIMDQVQAYTGNVIRFKYSSEMIPDLLYSGHGM